MGLMRYGPGDVGDWMSRWVGGPFRFMNQWLPQMPVVEIEERPESVVARVDVPGVDPEKLVVVVREDSLTIKGETKSEEGGDEAGTVRRESQFTKTVSLPTSVKAEESRATCRHGVLRVTMPKRHPGDEGHRIPVRQEG